MNEVATWTIYRNGLHFTNACVNVQSGVFVRPSGGIHGIMFDGHVPAFIASVQVWSRAQSIQQMKRIANASLGTSSQLSQSTPASSATTTTTGSTAASLAIAKSNYHASINTQFLLCSFRLNEGVGNCLHSPLTGFTWRGRQLQWHVPPHPLRIGSTLCERRNGVGK